MRAEGRAAALLELDPTACVSDARNDTECLRILTSFSEELSQALAKAEACSTTRAVVAPSSLKDSLCSLACSNGLKEVHREALEVKNYVTKTTLIKDACAEQLPEALRHSSWLHFAGHANYKLHGYNTLVLAKGNDLEVVERRAQSLHSVVPS